MPVASTGPAISSKHNACMCAITRVLLFGYFDLMMVVMMMSERWQLRGGVGKRASQLRHVSCVPDAGVALLRRCPPGHRTAATPRPQGTSARHAYYRRAALLELFGLVCKILPLTRRRMTVYACELELREVGSGV